MLKKQSLVDKCDVCGKIGPHNCVLINCISFKNASEPDDANQFDSIVDQMKDLHSRKNADYSGDDYLSDIKSSSRLSIDPWINCLLRMQQKMSRLENFARKNYLQVKDESVEDTLLDVAVYSILALILYRNKK